jgi:hemoglobin
MYVPTEEDTPYDRLGGRAAVLALAERFYDAMEATEPALTAMHACDAPGRVSWRSRERFGLFLVGWLGGPQEYIAAHGHPRLRMRHAGVSVDLAARDAWLRCMARALDGQPIDDETRRWLDQRFAEVADFLRNREQASAE